MRHLPPQEEAELAAMLRLNEVRLARDLRECGLTLREIADEFGVGTTTVSRWLSNPDGGRVPRGKRLS